MPQPNFFPDSIVLAWGFYLAVLGYTLAAAWTDLRALVVPKWLTLPALALGVGYNMVLSAWTDGPRGRFLIEHQGGLWGALDGLLLALAGFGLAFALFFVMWILGTCRGGDLKLFAALGAWVGPLLAVYLLAGTIFFVIVLAFGRLIYGALFGGFRRTVKSYTLAQAPKGMGAAGEMKTRRRLMAYSPAVALSAAVILLWVFRVPLHLAEPKPTPPAGQSAYHPGEREA